MRITRENAQLLIELAESVTEALEEAKEAAETWDGLQDEERTEDTAEEIREARENLEAALELLDATSLCELVNGKHAKSKARQNSL
jgi:flagellar hook-basal body complex protein FliE